MTRADRLSIGSSLPGFALLGLAVLVAVGGGMLLGMPTGWLIAMGIAALASGLVPQIGGTWMAAAALAVFLLSDAPAPARTAIAIVAVHLLHVLGSLLLVVSLRARIALRALRPTGIRFVVVQAIAQAAALLVAVLPQSGTLPLAVVAGAAAVLAVAIIGIRMLRTRRQAAFAPAAERRAG